MTRPRPLRPLTSSPIHDARLSVQIAREALLPTSRQPVVDSKWAVEQLDHAIARLSEVIAGGGK